MRWRVSAVRRQDATLSLRMVMRCQVAVDFQRCHEVAGNRGNWLCLTRGQTCIRNARPQPEQPKEKHAGCPSAQLSAVTEHGWLLFQT